MPPPPPDGGRPMDEILVSSPQKLVAGESTMIDFALWTEVHARCRRGQGKRTMARELGLERQTVKRILAQERLQKAKKPGTSKPRYLQEGFARHLRDIARTYPAVQYPHVVLVIEKAPWHKGAVVTAVLAESPH